MKLSTCPYCGSEAEIDRPFSRLIKILWWWIEIPLKIWDVGCSECCDGEMQRKWGYEKRKSKRAAIRAWEEYAHGR